MKLNPKFTSGRFYLAIIAGICILILTSMVSRVVLIMAENDFENAMDIVRMVVPILAGVIGGIIGFYFSKKPEAKEVDENSDHSA